ncbi:MAG: hypothetical protein ABFD44_00945 [Anaerolineaceae bacterium]
MGLQGLTQRPVVADFLTNSFRLMGKVYIPSSGLLTLMNDQSSVCADVIQGQMARLTAPEQGMEPVEVTRLVKRHVVAVCVSRREDVGPQAFPRLGFAPLTDYSVLITTDMYEIQGVIQWAGRLDIASLMAVDMPEFFPIFKATITALQSSNLVIECPIVLLNRAFISAVIMKEVSDRTAA